MHILITPFNLIVTDDTAQRRVELNKEREKFFTEKRKFFRFLQKTKMAEKKPIKFDDENFNRVMKEGMELIQKVNEKIKLYKKL